MIYLLAGIDGIYAFPFICSNNYSVILYCTNKQIPTEGCDFVHFIHSSYSKTSSLLRLVYQIALLTIIQLVASCRYLARCTISLLQELSS